MKHLIPCPECNRHVRVSELECPFCALPLDLANTPPPQLPRSRLSRAATLAFGATLVSATAISACGDSTAANVGGGGLVYGAPPGGEFGVAGFQNTGGDGGIVPLYGAPDAGMGGTIDLPGAAGAAGASGEAGAGGAPDPSGGKGGAPVAVYGGPP